MSLLWQEIRRKRGKVLFLVHGHHRSSGIIRRGSRDPFGVWRNTDQVRGNSSLLEFHHAQIDVMLGLDMLYESRSTFNPGKSGSRLAHKRLDQARNKHTWSCTRQQNIGILQGACASPSCVSHKRKDRRTELRTGRTRGVWRRCC